MGEGGGVGGGWSGGWKERSGRKGWKEGKT